MVAQQNFSARELAARAALARFDDPLPSSSSAAASARGKRGVDEIDISSSDEEDNDNNESIDEISNHKLMCGCRTCSWSKMFNLE